MLLSSSGLRADTFGHQVTTFRNLKIEVIVDFQLESYKRCHNLGLSLVLHALDALHLIDDRIDSPKLILQMQLLPNMLPAIGGIPPVWFPVPSSSDSLPGPPPLLMEILEMFHTGGELTLIHEV